METNESSIEKLLKKFDDEEEKEISPERFNIKIFSKPEKEKTFLKKEINPFKI